MKLSSYKSDLSLRGLKGNGSKGRVIRLVKLQGINGHDRKLWVRKENKEKRIVMGYKKKLGSVENKTKFRGINKLVR